MVMLIEQFRDASWQKREREREGERGGKRERERERERGTSIVKYII